MFLFVILISSVGLASCQIECEVCPYPCECSRSSVDCRHQNLTAVPVFTCLRSRHQVGRRGAINLSHNDIAVINWNNLPNIGLCHTDLRNNKITGSVGALTATRCRELLLLSLESNMMSVLSSSFLVLSGRERMLNYFEIRLQNNVITEVHEGAINFPSGFYVHGSTVYLSQNRIRYIHPDAFLFRVRGRFALHLENNQITSLSSADFVSFFFAVPQRYAPERVSLELYLGNNNITEVSAGSFRRSSRTRLQNLYINLSNNEVSYIDTDAFDLRVHNDLSLHLSWNKVTSLRDISLPGILSVRSRSLDLRLEGNLIENLRPEEEAVISDAGIHFLLSIKDNPLKCGCEMRWIAMGNSALLGAIIRSLHTWANFLPRCASPHCQRGQLLTSLSPDDFRCPAELDSAINVNITAPYGEPLSLRCPITDADPPVIERYYWVFEAKERLGSTPTGWDQVKTTDTNELVVESFVAEGVFRCVVLSSEDEFEATFSLTIAE